MSMDQQETFEWLRERSNRLEAAEQALQQAVEALAVRTVERDEALKRCAQHRVQESCQCPACMDTKAMARALSACQAELKAAREDF